MDKKIGGHMFRVPALTLRKLSALRWGPSIFAAEESLSGHMLLFCQLGSPLTLSWGCTRRLITLQRQQQRKQLSPVPRHALRESQM